MLSKNTLCTGALYTHDSWDHYWEGALNRVNGNIGTVTTQSVSWSANYGLINRINLIGDVPYVWTKPSAGVLHGQSGIQDLTLAAKFNVLKAPVGQSGTFRLIAVLYGAIPLTNCTPDLQPLSILLHAPNSLTVGERELIATYVSALNDCYYCQTAHGAIAAAHLDGDEEIVRRVKADFRHSDISEKLKALLVIAGKV